MRHAPARERDITDAEDDAQRPLTSDGEKKARRIARGLRALDVSFDLIFASPLERAQATARIVAGELGLEDAFRLHEELAPKGDPETLIEQLARLAERPKRVLLVGHEPYLGRLTAMLVAGNTGAEIKFKKGGLCRLSVDALRYGACARLEWLLPPRLLEELD